MSPQWKRNLFKYLAIKNKIVWLTFKKETNLISCEKYIIFK
jgi:hypothetical protein